MPIDTGYLLSFSIHYVLTTCLEAMKDNKSNKAK